MKSKTLLLILLFFVPVSAYAQTAAKKSQTRDSSKWSEFDLDTKQGVAALLSYLGHADVDSFRKYSRYAGAKVPVGDWCKADEESLYRRFCTCPDISAASTNKPHWDEKKLLIHTQVPGRDAAYGERYLQAAQAWSKVCNLKFEGVANRNDSDIWATFQRIDGPGRTLAWSELPSVGLKHGQRRLQQRYDSGDRENPITTIHEHGHAIGIDHVEIDRRNPGQNIMEAFLGNQTRFGPLDISEAVERYGKVITTVPPPVADCGTKVGETTIGGKVFEIWIKEK